jgi:predicted ribosomally synthesized peptide with SipW-like signal peptide
MNKNNVLIGILALIIGIVGTNAYLTNTESKQMNMNMDMNMSKGNMHQMSDGSVMGNGAGSMDSMMMDMLGNMKGKSGKELEKIFITDMIVHHQGAVDMTKLLLEDKTIRPELVKFANDIITAQEGEIKQMNEWLKSY